MLVSSYVKILIKFSMVMLFSNFIYLKITNHEKLKSGSNIILIISSIAGASVYIICVKFGLTIMPLLLSNLLNGIVLFIINNKKKINFIFAYILSFIISYGIYGIAVILSSFVIGIIKTDINESNMFCIVIIMIINVILNIMFGKIKRIKKGFNFLESVNTNITIAILLFCGIIIFVFELLPKNIEYESQELRFVGAIFIVISLFMFIKKLITKHYKNNMRDRTVIIQKEEIDANEKIIEELKEQNLKLATTIHKYNHKLSALENSIRKTMANSSAEFSSELSIVLEQTKKIEKQFADETKVNVALPTINVVAIDNMLEYMRNECANCGIDFTLKLNDSIISLLEKHISEDKFETLLGDHIKDAIIAVNSKSEGYKSIMVLIGIVDNAYELAIYDTGIEFEIPTLLKLGLEPITTHKDSGGSGLGFMTTFETLKTSKASLVIEEYDTRTTNYTKSVTIRFDGKCEYRVYSYRSEELKKNCAGRRIIIKKI